MLLISKLKIGDLLTLECYCVEYYFVFLKTTVLIECDQNYLAVSLPLKTVVTYFGTETILHGLGKKKIMHKLFYNNKFVYVAGHVLKNFSRLKHRN